MRDGEEFLGINADIKFVSHKEFGQLPTDSSGHLPGVGVVDTGLKEFCKITKVAARRGWNTHFRFEEIPTSEALGRAFEDGVNQCICLIPKKGHKYLERVIS